MQQEQPGTLSLRVNGVLRTEVTAGTWCGLTAAATVPPAPAPKASCVLCKVPDYIYNATVHELTWVPGAGLVHLSAPGSTSCTGVTANGLGQTTPSERLHTNPPLYFSSVDAATTYEYAADGSGGRAVASFAPLHAQGVDSDVLIMTSLADTAACRAAAPSPGAKTIFMTWGGATYKHDPRLKLLGNTVDSPGGALGAGNVLSAMGDGATTCPNVARTFVNAAGCVRRATCAPLRFSAAPVVLSAPNCASTNSHASAHSNNVCCWFAPYIPT